MASRTLTLLPVLARPCPSLPALAPPCQSQPAHARPCPPVLARPCPPIPAPVFARPSLPVPRQVLPPATITRVTDYVPEIVRFVASLERDGLAYPLDGSVYFDTTAFTRTPQHVYGRLQPARQQGADADDGQGPATRKSPRDFALWKAVRADPAEPWRTLASWPSPWGPGRPGWHIECSVMARCVP